MGLVFALTLFGSVTWFWISVALLLIIFFVSDLNENGFYAFGSLVIVSILYYFWGDIKLILPLFTFVNISIYLGVGFVFSSLRVFFAARSKMVEIKNYPNSADRLKQEFKNDLQGNVSRWLFMWPISLINWVLTDLLKDFWNYIYSKIGGYYNYIVDLGFKSIK